MMKKKYPPNWVRHYRNLAKLSAEELGEKIGMSGEGITYIERSERGLSIENAKRIADILGCHYIDLIDGPADIVVKNKKEQELLNLFRGISDSTQDRVLGILEEKAKEATKKK